MPRQITQYRIFIGSPGGLTKERKAFQEQLDDCSKSHGAKKDVHFEPVGWEDTLPGVGRPQELINRDLEDCDYAVFVFHDRWGSPTGQDGKVGTEEEWELAEKLYEAGKIRNIVLFFKAIAPGRAADPGDQLKAVLAFRKKIEDGKRHLFRDFTSLDSFRKRLNGQLAQWLADHDKKGSLALGVALDAVTTPSATVASTEPGFAFWLAEAKATRNTPAVSLHFAEKASALAMTDLEWADARNSWAVAKFGLDGFDEAIAAFREISGRLSLSRKPEERHHYASALYSTGVSLGAIGRNEDAIAVYDDVIARFSTTSEPAICEVVAKALVNKGVKLGEIGRTDDEIAVYDDVIARFSGASETIIPEQVAKALFNKGVTFHGLGQRKDAIAVYEDLVARFADELMQADIVGRAKLELARLKKRPTSKKGK
ncbi:MAG: DUF4062 domain-containing protein [Hyphomicrobiales bacterium]|nr:DUF4062 domain-containing protein [Hyphomicrobiales bacterium]